MPLQKFLIAPLKSGLQTNVKPWLIADDAYAELRNAYTWRGRVKKRFGAQVMDQSVGTFLEQQFTRLRINLKNTDGAGDADGNLIADIGLQMANLQIGLMFSIGNDYYTVVALGNPSVMITTSATAILYTLDTTTGAYVFAGATPDVAVYFYPSLPVMHFGLYDSIRPNDDDTIAFDTQFSYSYTQGVGWNRSGVAHGLWTGSNSQFHWTTNYRGATSSAYIMFVVNNNPPDGIQYFDGTNWATLAAPVLDAAGSTLLTSLIVLPFKDRLLFINVTENIAGVTRFTNRVVFSQNGSPFDVDAFRQDIVGRGGYIEAPTKEAIISAEFLKDRLIVFFESSTWELVYNSNQVLPFSFQQINTELGVESQNSIIPFDKVAIGMGSTGVHACTGVNVERIDDLIPSEIFDISNINAGPSRVYGIRDYYEELCYWTFAASPANYRDNNVFPNRVLVYDYVNTSWSFNDDSITALGYFFLQDNLLVWQLIANQWQNMAVQWNDGESDNLFRAVIAGNQEGWTFLVRPDVERNCMSLQITNIAYADPIVTITVINHNLPDQSFVFINNVVDAVGGNVGTALNGNIWQVTYISANTFYVVSQATVGLIFTGYSGGGTIERVSQIDILTKQYNFFPDQGKNTFIDYADFYVDKTETGEITVDYFISDSELSMVQQAQATGAIIGNNILETSPYVLKPFEQVQDQFWHRLYFQTYGETFQFRLYFTDQQMLDPEVVFVEFTLNAVMYYAQPEKSYL